MGKASSSTVTVSDPAQSGPGAQELLLSIPGAIAHLVSGQESCPLGSGVFSLLRLAQADGTGIAVFAKLGQDLQWPITRDQSATKLDATHYFFSLKLLPELEEDESVIQGRDPETLIYGVSFPSPTEPLLSELDKFLDLYSSFSVPEVVEGKPGDAVTPQKKGRRVRLEEFFFRKPNKCADNVSASIDKPVSEKNTNVPPSAAGTTSTAPNKDIRADGNSMKSDEKRKLEEQSLAYWAALAPNVEDYSNSVSKGIAGQSGHVIDGLFWCSNATIAQLERLGDYARANIKPKDKQTQISPRILRNLRRARKMSKMTDRVAKGVLAGVVTATGLASGSIIRSKAGKKFFSMLPGEVALVSLDAFAKVFDAVELAGKSVLHSTRVVTSGVVAHRYGEQAGEVASEGLATIGHVLSTAWTVTKVRKALNPNKGSSRVSKSALLKAAIKGKAAV